MNQIRARVVEIESEGILHLVKLDFYGTYLSMVSLELNADIRVGKEVLLSIKSTAVSIAKELPKEQKNMLSISNSISARITSIAEGVVLSSVLMDTNGFEIESIVTAEACRKMALQKQDRVLMLIRASEISIVETIDD